MRSGWRCHSPQFESRTHRPQSLFAATPSLSLCQTAPVQRPCARLGLPLSRHDRSLYVGKYAINISAVNEHRSSLASHSPGRRRAQAEPCFLDRRPPLLTSPTACIIRCHDVVRPPSCHLSPSVSARTCRWSSTRSRRVQMDATNSKPSSYRNSALRKESRADGRKTGLRRTSPIHPR